MNDAGAHTAARAFLIGLATLVLGVALAETRDATQLSGRAELPEGLGGLVLQIEPVIGRGEPTPVERWDAFVEADGGARWRLVDATHPAIHVVPAGRYRLDTIRSESGLRVNGIMSPPDWFEVVAGRIVYAGRWWIDTTIRLDLRKQVRGGVSFPREPLQALDEGPEGPLARYLFWLARRNEPAAPLPKR